VGRSRRRERTRPAPRASTTAKTTSRIAVEPVDELMSVGVGDGDGAIDDGAGAALAVAPPDGLTTAVALVSSVSPRTL
jgi:hypothetical protein